MKDINLWASFLSEARQKVSAKLSPNKSLLILGANGSGKTTLISKLRKAETLNNGCGLEYTFLDVRDEYLDEHAKLGIWILDSDPSLLYMLKRVLREDTFRNTVVTIVVSMSTPWYLLEELEYWMKILKKYIQNLALTEDELKELKCKIIQRWKEYTPVYNTNENNNFGSNVKINDLHIENEDIIVNNLGIDIIVVVTKTDLMSALETNEGYTREHFVYIQQHIRRFCLQNGLSLIYTSAKENINIQLLHKYLMHKIYYFSFQEPVILSEHNSIFIPAGFDNMRNISVLFDNLIILNPDDDYKIIIRSPNQYQKLNESVCETIAEDEQIFLRKQLEILLSNKISGVVKMERDQKFCCSSPIRTPISPIKTTLLKKNDLMSPFQSSNSKELSSFFNSLLKKGFHETTPKSPTNTSIESTTSCTPVCYRNIDDLTPSVTPKDAEKKKPFSGRDIFRNNSSK
ncbi:hypothetical protein PGB90_004439 [Kerria lacca]